MRQYIRHPTSIPIQIEDDPEEKSFVGGTVRENQSNHTKTRNLSEGGLCFICNHRVTAGTTIGLHITCVAPDYHGTGIVTWCHQAHSNAYEVGVRFTDANEFFKTRMVEQVCQIEAYRRYHINQGRVLSSEEAAQEWITNHAAYFDQHCTQTKY